MKNCCRQVLPAAVFCVRSWFAQFARAIPFAKNAALLLFRCCAAPFAHEMALPSWISLSIFSCKHEICLWDPPASHHSQKTQLCCFFAAAQLLFAHEMALPSWISLSIFSCKHESCLGKSTSELCPSFYTRI